MEIEVFKEQLHAIFENCDYSTMLKENGEEKIAFSFPNTDGTVLNIEVEPNEKEFYVYKDGKQIDLFNDKLVDQDGAISKDIRKQIVDAWAKDPKNPAAIQQNTPTETPVATEVPPPASTETPVAEETEKIEEMNSEILANMRKQYPEKDEKELKSLYYATMNAHKQNPETGHKIS